MRQFSLIGKRKLEFNDHAVLPQAAPGEIVVKVEACTVCGRSDLSYFHYHGLRDHCSTGCFGHEISGTIAEIGRKDSPFKIDQRVFIRTPLTTGYAEYAKAREVAVGRLPDDVPFDQGAILQLLPLAIHATRGVKIGDRVLIIGQGPVGLMALIIAKLRGAAAIITTDLDPWRLETSKKCGADTVIVAQKGVSPNEQAELGEIDVAIDAVGTPGTVNACVDIVRQAGLVIFLGTHHIDTKVTFDLVKWEHKGLRVHSSAEPTDEARHHAMHQAVRLVESGRVNTAALLTHRMPLESLPSAIEKLSKSAVLQPEIETPTYAGPPEETLKVAICP